MKSTGKVVIGMILGVALTSGAVVVAEHGGRYWKHGDRAGFFAEFVVAKAERELELSVGQSERLANFIDRLLSVRREFRLQRDDDRRRLLELLSTETLDQQRLLDMIGEKTALVSDNAPQAVAALAEFSDSLNASQKRELREFLEHKMGRRGHYH